MPPTGAPRLCRGSQGPAGGRTPEWTIRDQPLEDVAKDLLHRQVHSAVRGEDQTILVLEAEDARRRHPVTLPARSARPERAYGTCVPNAGGPAPRLPYAAAAGPDGRLRFPTRSALA